MFLQIVLKCLFYSLFYPISAGYSYLNLVGIIQDIPGQGNQDIDSPEEVEKSSKGHQNGGQGAQAGGGLHEEGTDTSEGGEAEEDQSNPLEYIFSYKKGGLTAL